MSHDPKLHSNRNANLIGSSANKYLTTLRKSVGAVGIVITKEPCGCLQLNTNLAEPELSQVLMQLAADRKPGDTTQ